MKTVRKKSQLQEKDVAKQFGAKTVIASGSLWFADSDVRSDKFLIECKTTSKDFYPVTTKVWEKIEKEANKDRMRTPLLVVDLKDKDRYVIFNPNHFSALLNIEFEVIPTWGESHLSYRFKGTEEFLGEIIHFTLKALNSPKKYHNLRAMKVDRFFEIYKEELGC